MYISTNLPISHICIWKAKYRYKFTVYLCWKDGREINVRKGDKKKGCKTRRKAPHFPANEFVPTIRNQPTKPNWESERMRDRDRERERERERESERIPVHPLMSHRHGILVELQMKKQETFLVKVIIGNVTSLWPLLSVRPLRSVSSLIGWSVIFFLIVGKLHFPFCFFSQ